MDDLLRDQYLSAREFIYTVIEEPVIQAAGIYFPDTSHFPDQRGLRQGFDLERFRGMCGASSWAELYNGIPQGAADYLLSYIPEGAIAVGYEMPPWLLALLRGNDVPYIDIRISPIRFARDLYLVLQSNVSDAHDRISRFHVSQEEIRVEAGMLRASAKQRGLGKALKGKLTNAILFIGQTRTDASIISAEGKILDICDFREKIKGIGKDRKFFYKPHPYDKRFARREHRELEKMLGRKICAVKENVYQLMASPVDFELMTISSGTTQEAVYFRKTSHTLFHPICEPYSDAKPYSHIRFIDFCSPEFWGHLLGFETSHLKFKSLSRAPDNLMRKFHNAWWGYSEYLIDNDQFWRQVITRSSRNILSSRISKLKRLFHF